MKKARFTESQIVGILKEAEPGMRVAEVRRKHGIPNAKYYNWRSKFGEMSVSEAQRLRALGLESSKPKRLLTDVDLDISVPKNVVGRKW